MFWQVKSPVHIFLNQSFSLCESFFGHTGHAVLYSQWTHPTKPNFVRLKNLMLKRCKSCLLSFCMSAIINHSSIHYKIFWSAVLTCILFSSLVWHAVLNRLIYAVGFIRDFFLHMCSVKIVKFKTRHNKIEYTLHYNQVLQMSYMHQHINKIFNMYVDALNMVQHFFFLV